tara:strand:- start:415 stop:732 length:318 start_codon:yes stop_codon:yes gene_type:complete
MNINVEEILMVIVAFLIGWFLSNMMNGGSVEGAEYEGCGGAYGTQCNALSGIEKDLCEKDQNRAAEDWCVANGGKGWMLFQGDCDKNLCKDTDFWEKGQKSCQCR